MIRDVGHTLKLSFYRKFTSDNRLHSFNMTIDCHNQLIDCIASKCDFLKSQNQNNFDENRLSSYDNRLL